MKLARLTIQNFRGIKGTTLFFPDQVVLVGDNNVGKSTVFEAIDLALGPDRLNRHPRIDEHDFHLGDYLTPAEQPRKEVSIEAVVTDLNTDTDHQPKWRTMGTGLPGYAAGWFKLRNGTKGLLYVTDRTHVARIPTTEGYIVMLSVSDPAALIDALKQQSMP